MRQPDTDENLGRRAARTAVNAGVPRWVVIGDAPEARSCIDPSSGLPIQVIHPGPVDRGKILAFASGHNKEISAAIAAGEVRWDFRPFLRAEHEIEAALASQQAGLLSPDQPIRFPQHGVLFEIHIPKPPRKPPKFRQAAKPSVRRIRDGESTWVAAYDGTPIRYATLANDAVLAFRFPRVRLTFHVETGALLQRFAAG